MGLKWNPFTGTLDIVGDSGGGYTEALSAKILKISLTATEDISALKLVYQTGINQGALADYRFDAKKDAIGVSLTSALSGNDFDVLLFGRVEDLFFNFAVNELLFLGEQGSITNIAPTTGHSVLIGKGLGSGAIFVTIERPIQI